MVIMLTTTSDLKNNVILGKNNNLLKYQNWFNVYINLATYLFFKKLKWEWFIIRYVKDTYRCPSGGPAVIISLVTRSVAGMVIVVKIHSGFWRLTLCEQFRAMRSDMSTFAQPFILTQWADYSSNHQDHPHPNSARYWLREISSTLVTVFSVDYTKITMDNLRLTVVLRRWSISYEVIIVCSGDLCGD